MSIKPEITEEFKALCEGVLDGTIEVKQCEGQVYGYTIAKLGGCSIVGYPWSTAIEIARAVLNGGVTLEGYNDGDFYWLHGRTKLESRSLSIGCTYSMDGKPWSEQEYFKFPARVALESLRGRLDRGAL